MIDKDPVQDSHQKLYSELKRYIENDYSNHLYRELHGKYYDALHIQLQGKIPTPEWRLLLQKMIFRIMNDYCVRYKATGLVFNDTSGFSIRFTVLNDAYEIYPTHQHIYMTIDHPPVGDDPDQTIITYTYLETKMLLFDIGKVIGDKESDIYLF